MWRYYRYCAFFFSNIQHILIVFILISHSSEFVGDGSTEVGRSWYKIKVIVYLKNDFHVQSSALDVICSFYCDFCEGASVFVDESKLEVARGEAANKRNARFSWPALTVLRAFRYILLQVFFSVHISYIVIIMLYIKFLYPAI